MMKDYNSEISYTFLNDFLHHAIEHGYDVDGKEGVLNDTYVIFNVDKALSIKGVKPRNYIVLYPKYLNEWSNSFHMLMTDDEDKMKQFLQ